MSSILAHVLTVFVRSISGAILAIGALTLAAAAQTAANGPYYATPSWDQTIPTSTRFVVLTNFKSQAVLDRETGLVWQRAPSPVGYAPTLAPGVFGGIYASEACLSATTGGRMGWRLPGVAEMLTLLDANQVRPVLPAGHPFQGSFGTFWTSTRYYPDRYPLAYRSINMDGGSLGASDGGIFKYPVWCVRGGAEPHD